MAEDSNEPVDLCILEPDPTDAGNDETTNQEPFSQGDNGESNTTCMICMEEWTIGSAHRVCCLKCGHLFGRSCIERWIREKGAQHAKCPSCNKPTKKVDIRDLWCKTVRAFDSTELMELQKQLETERSVCAKERATNFHLRNINNQLYSDIDKLKKDVIERDQRLAKLERILNQFNKLKSEQLSIEELASIEPESMMVDIQAAPQELKGKFYFAKKIESHPAGGCKCFTICPLLAEILIAQPLPVGNPKLGNDFGIRKYSLIDPSVHSFIYLHSQPITSVQVKPYGDLMLTSGQDKKIHLTSINNSRKVQSYDCRNEPLCVSWSVHRDQQFYVVSRNCYMTLYDMRNTSDYIYQRGERVARTAMISMGAISQSNELHGVVANDARGSQFLEVTDGSDYELEIIDPEFDHLKAHPLPFSGLMGTVDFHKPTSTTLITTRRSPVNQSATHSLVRLKRIETEDGNSKIDCESVRTFQGRSPDMLSQSRILKHPTLDNQMLVGAWDDLVKAVQLWDASDNTVYQTLRTNEFVRDMTLYTPENSNQHLFYTLADKGFSIYRWDYA